MCVCVCVFIYIYIHTNICIHIYIYIMMHILIHTSELRSSCAGCQGVIVRSGAGPPSSFTSAILSRIKRRRTSGTDHIFICI